MNTPPRKLILRSPLAPGDIVMLTAAVRDLHVHYPRRFLTDVRTRCPALWENNPHLTPLREHEAEVIDCHYPLIDRCNGAPYHCLHGFIEFLNERLELQIRPTLFRGDIHLAEREKAWRSQVHELTGRPIPFWILVHGGKFDVTIKWWETGRVQQVIDHFRGKIQFVQVGDGRCFHPPLKGVIDLVGQTDLRQLIRLVYHAQGVLCPVTALMHLAAAVEVRPGQPPNRACVVLAGGREPPHWEAYPHHQFIHTVGALTCCAQGGCWRDRVRPLRDGDPRDRPERLCTDVVNDLPRCMDLITADEVIRRIEWYFAGGALRYLDAAQAAAAARAVALTRRHRDRDTPLTVQTARARAEEYLSQSLTYPDQFSGRGIVICGGGRRYFPSAWVCQRMLRWLGCTLPIQLWHLGRHEIDERLAALARPFEVQCVDASEIRLRHPIRRLGGWELKAYALIHCRFQQVLLLDADNVPVKNPGFLFDTPQFKRTGAILWPDHCRLERTRSIWKLCGLRFRDEPEIESGQILVDKQRCWRALSLALWYNNYSDLFYQHVHGDKETFHLAFRKVGKSYSMPERPIEFLAKTMCQHDFAGHRIFQHRNGAKWRLDRPNPRVPGFQHEAQCRAWLKELKRQLNESPRRGHLAARTE